MPRLCVQAVEKLCKNLCKAGNLCTSSTQPAKYLTGQVFIMRSLYTWFEQMLCAYEQQFLAIYNLLGQALSPFYTPTMNTINLIKE